MDNVTAQKLASLKAGMSAAYDSGEWQRLAELDIQCQQTIRKIIADGPRSMLDELREMLGFYGKLIEKCGHRRSGIANEVKKLRHGRNRKDVYKKLDKLTANGS